jgi:hypothetical protein
MNEWKGEISKINERDWGSKTIYSWQIKGNNGWFRSEQDPCMRVGDCFAFSGESANKIDISTLKEISESDLKAEAKAQIQETRDAPPTTSPDYWRWKQMHDLDRESYYQWKDARADATRIVCAALDNDVLSLGQKKGLKLDMLIGMIKETTRQLLEESNGTDD